MKACAFTLSCLNMVNRWTFRNKKAWKLNGLCFMFEQRKSDLFWLLMMSTDSKSFFSSQWLIRVYVLSMCHLSSMFDLLYGIYECMNNIQCVYLCFNIKFLIFTDGYGKWNTYKNFFKIIYIFRSGIVKLNRMHVTIHFIVCTRFLSNFISI